MEGYGLAAAKGGGPQDLAVEQIARCSVGAASMLCQKGSMDVKVWARNDMNTVCLKGPGRLGPDVKTVAQRRAYNADTGRLLLVEDGLPERPGFQTHREFAGPINTTTILLYRSHPGWNLPTVP